MKPDVCLGETQECNRDKLAVRGSVDETDAPLCGHALRTTSRVNEDGGVRVQRVMPGHVAWRGGELAAVCGYDRIVQNAWLWIYD